jgi:hypothetical protein
MRFVRNQETGWGEGDKDVYDYWPTTSDAAAREEYMDQQLDNAGCPFAWLLDAF